MSWHNAVPNLNAEIGRISCHIWNALLAPTIGFNKRNMEDQRRHLAEKEAKARRATERQILEDAERPVTAWNERQAAECSPRLFGLLAGRSLYAGGHRP